MSDSADARAQNGLSLARGIRAAIPTGREAAMVAGSALLTVLAFPDFELWFLAWISLAPLLVVVIRARSASSAFVIGWVWGVIFFYGTCWWLTYPVIHYGQISRWFAYPLLLLPVALGALFPALGCGLLFGVIRRFGHAAIITAPLIWISIEWLRYAVTGQLWNALGYSQAFHPLLIQSARWGGVYAVTFVLMTVNAAVAFAVLRFKLSGLLIALIPVVFVGGTVVIDGRRISQYQPTGELIPVVAVQPNVPMDGPQDSATLAQLLNRHLDLSKQGLSELPEDVGSVLLIIWPESPMNFSYSRDPQLKETLSGLARSYSLRQHRSVLLNSLETSSDGDEYNSALIINEEGRILARYDKIRLMPFGEYVPLPRWLPGASSVRSIVGEFTPGSSYTLMPLGALRAGVFICIEAAHPSVARSFTNEGADVLINISNDGYLGPTAVMRQHLANAVFRAVENDRVLLRATNSGISALIWPTGEIRDSTPPFVMAVRSWVIAAGGSGKTFYSRHGDIFVYACALISLGLISASFTRRRAME